MLAPAGYSVRNRIHASPHSEVYAAVREADGLQVILKTYPRAESDSGNRRARREFEILQRVHSPHAVPGVVKPVELLRCNDRDVLVVEQFDGAPLSGFTGHRAPPLSDVLSVAMDALRNLAEVHGARVVHKDIKLANILVRPGAWTTTCLIDFGVAAEFGHVQRATDPRTLEGTLEYIAPEQTGRIGLGIDFRTDLYAFGAALYELLTGRLPFESRSPLDLIHAHLTRRPTPPSEVDPDVPVALSRIVLKLLEKDPERRYQTASGLHADLAECQKQLQTHGEIDDDLGLGTQDASDRLRFPSLILGRDREVRVLRDAFDRARAGRPQVVWLSGPPGIGKSSLAGTLRERLAETGGYLAHAQFDLAGHEQPYGGFAAVLGSLLDQILTESSDRLRDWRRQLEEGLGKVASALAELVPNLAFVIEGLPQAPSLGPRESRERLALAVSRFIRVFATRVHPLVLFFDDLQWADANSRELLESVLRAAEGASLLVIGSHRDTDRARAELVEQSLSRIESWGIPIEKLALAPLTQDDINALLAQILSRSQAETLRLAERVGVKTQRNPLLVRRLLLHLWDRGAIRHVHGEGWTWNETELAELEVSDDAADILSQKLALLPAKQRELLTSASAVGNVFEPELLLDLTGVDRVEILQNLALLTQEGLVMPCREGFKFAHNRIREGALALLSSERRVALHYQIGKLLLERMPAEQRERRVFEIVDHFDRALDQVPEDERVGVLELNAMAARRALSSGAVEAAGRYLDAGRGLMRESDWAERRSLVYELLLASSEAAYQLRRFDLAIELLDDLEKRGLEPSERVQVTVKRINLYNSHRTTHETIRLMQDELERLGVRLPRVVSRWRWQLERLRTDWTLRGDTASRELRRDTRTSVQVQALHVFTSAAAPSMWFSDTSLAFLVTAIKLRDMLRHGYTYSPGVLLSAYVALRLGRDHDPRDLARHRRAALAWTEQVPHPTHGSRTHYIVTAFFDAWIEPRRDALERLRRIAIEAHEGGDLTTVVSAMSMRANYAALVGEPIEHVGRMFAEIDRGVVPGLGEAQSTTRIPLDYLAGECRELSVDQELVSCRERLMKFFGAHGHTAVRWLLVLCVLRDWQTAHEHAAAIQPHMFGTMAMSTHIVDYTFLHGLAAAALIPRTHGIVRRSHRRLLRYSRKRLQLWARYGPDFVHMSRWLDAESARLDRKPRQALELYRQAIERALTQGYLHHAALCEERRAEVLHEQRRELEAIQALRKAVQLYAEWGAFEKVKRLEAELRKIPSWIQNALEH